MATNGAVGATERATTLVCAILTEEFCVDPSRIQADASLTVDLWLDSLALIELRQILEDRFTVTIDDERAFAVRRVGDLVQLVQELSPAAGAEVAGQ
jgi:acyl carrier protein